MDDKPATFWETLKDAFGCPESRIRLHNYQWNWRHRGWWMYCTKCDRAAWEDQLGDTNG